MVQPTTNASSSVTDPRDSISKDEGWLNDASTLLFRYTDSLYRASTLSEIYEAALDAITEGLSCARASILLMDDEGIMRFVAWRGLSARYRKAVEGHSPWHADDPRPDVICVEDIGKSSEADEIKDCVSRENICGLAFIPVTVAGKLAGKFMTYHDVARLFTAHERQLAVTIARQLGFAIERFQAERRAAQHAAIVASSEDAIVAKNLDGIIISWNDAATRHFGYTAEEVLGQSGAMLFPDDRADEEPRILAKIRAGEKIESYETVRLHKDGRLVHLSLTVSPILDSRGKVVGASKIARDITAKRRASEQQQLLLREMNHRVKNLFTVATSLVQLCARRSANAGELATKIVERLTALSRAHGLTMETSHSLSAAAPGTTSLRKLLATILEPFGEADDEAHGDIRFGGDEAWIEEKLVTSMAMLFYELATNAAKYGSLSVPGGHVAIEIVDRPEAILVTWQEVGGPPVPTERESGFGNSLINASARQLGAVERDWSRDGLKVTVSITKT